MQVSGDRYSDVVNGADTDIFEGKYVVSRPMHDDRTGAYHFNEIGQQTHSFWSIRRIAITISSCITAGR